MPLTFKADYVFMKVTFNKSIAKLMVLEYWPIKGPATEFTAEKRL